MRHTPPTWFNHTFNPWYKCEKVSPGYTHCYAESWANHNGLMQWGVNAIRRHSPSEHWTLPRRWNANAQRNRVRQRVFCSPLVDIFDETVPQAWRQALFVLIESTPHLDWLITTRRLDVVARLCESDAFIAETLRQRVWLGASISNQTEADRDIPLLRQIPCRLRWLHSEPLLGPIDLDRLLPAIAVHDNLPSIDWMIAGGECGRHARPMHPDWVRSLRDQCAARSIPFLFKQWGEFIPRHDAVKRLGAPRIVRRDTRPIPSSKHSAYATEHAFMQVLRVGKTLAGRRLDGVIHNGDPEPLKKTSRQWPRAHPRALRACR